MVHSWNSNMKSIPKESQGIEIIRSIFQSINVNQHQLPGSLTYSELKPKSLNNVSKQLKLNSKARSKFFYKNSFAKKDIKSRNNIQQIGNESFDTVLGGKSNLDESIHPNISSNKVNLLWINNHKKFKSSNEKVDSSIDKNPTPVPFNQRRLEEIRQYVEHILAQEDNKSFNEIPVKIDTSKDEFLFNIDANQQNKNEKYHQINFSINNYYQSPDLLKKFKSTHENIVQQDLLHTIKIDRQKTFSCKKEIETSIGFKSKIIGRSKDELNMIDNLNNSKYSELIKSKQLKTADNVMDKKINNSKSNPVNNKLSAVLTGQFKTAAKPSKMLIPQNFRGRALFQSFMHMNDLPEDRETVSNNHKNNKLKSSPENLKTFKLKSQKVNSHVHPTQKSSVSNKISPRNNIVVCDSQKLKSQNKKITKNKDEPQTGLVKSKTFVMEKKLDLVARKEVNEKIKTDSVELKKENYREGINVEDVINSKCSLISEEIFSEKEYSCELIEVNKTLKNTSDNELNNLVANNSKIDFLNDNKNEKINFNDDLKELNTAVLLKDNKLHQVDTFTETKWFSQLSKVDTFTETEFSINQLNQINAYTETDLIDCEHKNTQSVDVKTSCDNLKSLISTNEISSQVFIDAEVFCNIPLIDTIKEESLEDLLGHESYCVADTQTSETLLLKYFSAKKKDASIETIKLKYQCENTNTDQVVLIDTATGRDTLYIQNFNCDSQSINTDNHLYGLSSEDFKITTHDVECQVSKLNCLASIDFDRTSNAASAISFEQVVSNLSSELISSQKSLQECTSKISDYDVVSCGSLNNIPTEVIRAFKIATERAQNLYQAYKIYQEYQQNKQESDNNLVENNPEKILLNGTVCEEIKSNYLIEKKISDSGIQEIRFIVQKLLDGIEEKTINVKEDKLKNHKDELSSEQFYR
ncbi:hypothetical protein KQX54_010105 [Cotesia glomerata]|uniref:Uncharacterized protein n=1 Tax=Cotesia glomerata TaxID=32391 RepID=A0AAV7HZP0_COTGL|nr:hypothetical protein KQX54_010105 [Cotesia glomerata]